MAAMMEAHQPDLLAQISQSVSTELSSLSSSNDAASSPENKMSKFLAGPSLLDQLAALDKDFDEIEADDTQEESAAVKMPAKKRKLNVISSSSSEESDNDADSLLRKSPNNGADDTLPTSEEASLTEVKDSSRRSDPRPHKKAKRAVGNSSEDDDMPERPRASLQPAPTASAQTKKERLLALANDRAATKAALSAMNKEYAEEDVGEESFEEEQPKAKKPKSKKPRKSKGDSEKSGKIKPLSNKELAEMHRQADETRRRRDAYIAPGLKQKRDLSTFMEKMNKAGRVPPAPVPKIVKQSSNFKSQVQSSAISKDAEDEIISATPLEQHAAMDLDDAESYNPQYLYSQQDSFTCNIPAKSKTKPISTTPSDDPIETSFIEAVDHPKPTTNHKRQRLVLEEDEELPDANEVLSAQLGEITARKAQAAIAAKRRLELLERKKAALARPAVDDAESSSSDLEILTVKPTVKSFKKAPIDPKTAIDNFGKRQRAASPAVPSESQIHRAGMAWGPNTKHADESMETSKNKLKAGAPLALDRENFNKSLLGKTAAQNIQSLNKRKSDWEARGGRERQVISAKAKIEVNADAKETLALFAAAAKAENNGVVAEDDDDADDADWDEGIELSGDERAEDSGSDEVASGAEDDVGSTAEEGEVDVEDAEGQVEAQMETEAGDDIERPLENPEINRIPTGDSLDVTIDADDISIDELPMLPPRVFPNGGLQKERSDLSVTTDASFSQTQLVEEESLPVFGRAAARLILPQENDGFGLTQAFEDSTQAFGEDNTPASTVPFKQAPPTQDLRHERAVNDIWKSQDALEGNAENLEEDAPIFGGALPRGADFNDLLSQPLVQSPEPVQMQRSQTASPENGEASFVSASPNSPTQRSLASSPTSLDERPKKLRRITSDSALDEAGPLSNASRSPSPVRPANAFDILQANARQTEKQPKQKKAKMNNMFVDDQANESDEDERFGGGLMGTHNKGGDGDEEDGSDGDEVIADLVDDIKVDASLQAEQDVLAEAKFREQQELDDAKRQKQAEKTTKGAWRQKRTGADVLSDSDYSDDEYGKSRGRQAYKEKKRNLGGKDEMDSIALNPDTAAFADSYRETHEVKGKGEDYDFLQAEAEASASEEEEDAEEERSRQKAARVRELDEFIETVQGRTADHNLLSTSSPGVLAKIRDRTLLAAESLPLPRRFNNFDEFADIDAEYAPHKRDETDHQKNIRKQDLLTDVRRQDSYSKRAGAGSSVTNMTRRVDPPNRSVSNPVLAAVSSLQKTARASLKTRSLSSVRGASFRR